VNHLTIQPGRNLLHYRIVDKLGEGGMGAVWRAVDTTLDREVAIKILPEAFGQDRDRRARFEREAKLLASLNHPNLAAVYGLHQTEDVFFLAMELVPGEDLAQRLARGPLPVDEALTGGRQLCDALQAAHDNGVIHRDLKPANIRMTPEGRIKVLDFGLARGPQPSPSGGDPSASPTVTSAGTLAGVILGTAAYMSPEQARAKAVDRRTDLWALGCVLYEMLTGRQAFAGETVTDILSTVISREPDWSLLPPGTPAATRRLLRRCINKDAAERLRDAADARLELSESDEPLPGAEAASSFHAAVPRRREAVAWLLVAVLVVATVVLALLSGRSGEQTAARLSYAFALHDLPAADDAVISPDGRYIAFHVSYADPSGAESGAREQGGLWIRELARREARPLQGTRSADEPFWSPDSRHIAFFAEGELKRVSASGTPPETLARVPGGWAVGDWGPDGTIIIEVTESPEAEGWYLLRPGARELEQIRSFAGQRLAPDKAWPSFLPDGEHLLFTEAVGGIGHVKVGAIGSDEAEVLTPADSLAVYAPPGYLLYVRDGALLAHPFDARSRKVTGEPVRLADSVHQFTPTGSARFSVSREGTLVFQRPPGGMAVRWVDRAGRTLGEVMEEGWYAHPRLSPDGRRLAIDVLDSRLGTPDIWVRDLERNVSTRVTSSPRSEYVPIWSPDGMRLLYAEDREGPPNLYLLRLDGSEPEVLVPPNRQVQTDEDWSSDGRYIVFSWTDREYYEDLWLIDLESDPTPRPLIDAPYNTFQARISPDGRWLAYASDETGRTEVYVRAFPESVQAVRISSDGGEAPAWSRDGKDLYFIDPGRALMAAAVLDRSDFGTGPPERLFRLEATPLIAYDVPRERDRFLVLVADPERARPPIEVVVGRF
jgi:dipeptidyl aminopeptidase/acylaminoacyl peptidase